MIRWSDWVGYNRRMLHQKFWQQRIHHIIHSKFIQNIRFRSTLKTLLRLFVHFIRSPTGETYQISLIFPQAVVSLEQELWWFGWQVFSMGSSESHLIKDLWSFSFVKFYIFLRDFTGIEKNEKWYKLNENNTILMWNLCPHKIPSRAIFTDFGSIFFSS